MDDSPSPRILVEGGPVHRRVNHVLALLVGSLIGTGASFGFVLHELHHGAVANCGQIEVVKRGLRETLEEAERFALSSPVRSKVEREAVATFYRDSLGRLRPRHC